MAIDTPHFDYPFRYNNTGNVVVNQQDSVQDVVASVTSLVLTPYGSRLEDPDYGFVDPTFGQQPLSPAVITAQLQRQEPRIPMYVDAVIDAVDSTIAHLTIELGVSS